MSKINLGAVVVVVAASGLWACSNSSPTDGGPKNEIRTSSLAVNENVVGYAHTLSASRFALGKAKLEADENGLHKWIGNDGVFAIDGVNGASAGIPNGDSTVFAKKRFSLSGDAHGALVRSYFVSNGLPADQIGFVQNLSHVEGGGVTGAPVSADQRFKAYFTVLTRQIAGIPAPDSHAWASMTDDGDVSAEAVHWPPIPKASVERALAFAGQMASDSYRADYFAHLPPGAERGQVVIRHGTRLDREAPFATVVWEYNIGVSGPNGATSSIQVRFDENANAVTLRRELPQGAPPKEQKE